MSPLDTTLHVERDELLHGTRRFAGRLRDSSGGTCGQFQVEASAHHCQLDLTRGSDHLQAHIGNPRGQHDSLLNTLCMPSGRGDILLNGQRIARYVAYGELAFDQAAWGSFKLVPDDRRRRFLWARAQGCPYGQASRYSSYRNALLIGNDALFASFCGYHKCTSLLNAADRACAACMPIEKQYGLLALCLIWHAYRPLDDNAIAALGRPIPDIPSFVVAEAAGKTLLSANPEDVRPLTARDQLLHFLSQPCQWYLGLPLLLLLAALVRDACVGALHGAGDIPTSRLWVTGLLTLGLLLAYVRAAFRHGPTRDWRVPRR